jgi:hypothetical protein
MARPADRPGRSTGDGLRLLLDLVLVVVGTVVAVVALGGEPNAGFLGAVIGMVTASMIWRSRLARRSSAVPL